MNIFTNHRKILKTFNISVNDINEIIITSSTELEFSVKTRNNIVKIYELLTSQALHEHYWARIKDSVRIALRKALILMEKYSFGSEMDSTEVDGVKMNFLDI